jgi:ATP-dependent helicase/nuclease subunit A
MTANIAAGDPDRYIDGRARLCATRLLRCAPWELRDHEAQERLRERAEGVRVAYVAATRARDLLVVPAVGDQECDGWLSPLNKAVYPGRGHERIAAAAAGCPKFGETSVVDRPFFCSDEPSVKPGLHTAREGTHSVVWWDPHALNLQAPANFGLRQEIILEPAVRGELESESVKAFRAWQAKRNEITDFAQTKQFDIFTATEAAEAPADIDVAIVHDAVEKKAERPSGPRFGTLVHTLLRDAPLDADAAALAALAEVHGRLLGATPEETEESSAALLAALEHPLIERARQAKIVRRELPIMLKLDGSRVLEGVIDLAFESDGKWHVVDFKTDADLGPNRARYERQLRWYALALARLNNSPVEAHLLSV